MKGEGAQMTNWVISCNFNHYNVIDAFKKLNTLHWKQSTNVQAGDIVFIYVTNPIGAIKFKTKVNKVDLPNVEIDDQEFIIDGANYENHNRYMELELLRTYNDDLFTYDVLKNNGLKSVQGPTKMTDELLSFISQTTNTIRKQEYFLVFQNKSFKEEYSGGYLWAPQHNKNGGRVTHWEQIKNVKKGDVIIHSFSKEIVAISVAKNDVYEANKPSYKGTHDEWQDKGWKVDTEYYVISKPIITSDHMEELLYLQSDSNAPFNVSGRDNTGYLFKANRELFEYIIEELLKNNEIEAINRFRFNRGSKHEENQLDLDLLDEIDSLLNQEEKTEYAYTPEPKDKPEPNWTNGKEIYLRNRVTAMNALIRAKHQCEVDRDHPSFIRRSTGKNYSEPHHLIPLAYQNQFDKSLDVEANIVSLCSNCHNEIHYGKHPDKIINILYNLRKEELEQAGIPINYTDLKNLYY